MLKGALIEMGCPRKMRRGVGMLNGEILGDTGPSTREKTQCPRKVRLGLPEFLREWLQETPSPRNKFFQSQNATGRSIGNAVP